MPYDSGKIHSTMTEITSVQHAPKMTAPLMMQLRHQNINKHHVSVLSTSKDDDALHR
jgi:hypothetical protein